jgi:hypothetical protein
MGVAGGCVPDPWCTCPDTRALSLVISMFLLVARSCSIFLREIPVPCLGDQRDHDGFGARLSTLGGQFCPSPRASTAVPGLC